MKLTLKQIAQLETIKYSLQDRETPMSDDEVIAFALEFTSEIYAMAKWQTIQQKQNGFKSVNG